MLIAQSMNHQSLIDHYLYARDSSLEFIDDSIVFGDRLNLNGVYDSSITGDSNAIDFGNFIFLNGHSNLLTFSDGNQIVGDRNSTYASRQ